MTEVRTPRTTPIRRRPSSHLIAIETLDGVTPAEKRKNTLNWKAIKAARGEVAEAERGIAAMEEEHRPELEPILARHRAELAPLQTEKRAAERRVHDALVEHHRLTRAVNRRLLAPEECAECP